MNKSILNDIIGCLNLTRSVAPIAGIETYLVEFESDSMILEAKIEMEFKPTPPDPDCDILADFEFIKIHRVDVVIPDFLISNDDLIIIENYIEQNFIPTF